MIEDAPVSRPSDPQLPEWPPHTPDFRPSRPGEQTSEDVETEISELLLPADPVTGSSGSSSSSGSGTSKSGGSGGGSSSGTGSSSGGTGSGGSSGTGSSTGTKVHFPGEDLIPIPSCGGELFYAYVNSTGDCRKLWTDSEAGCEEGSWFVVDPDTGDAACRPRLCPVGETQFGDVCRVNTDGQSDACAAGQGVFLDQFGRGFCDCLARQVYWPEERRCYPAYERGPCPAGEHLAVSEDSRRAVCRPTGGCQDGEVLWGDTERRIPARCYSAARWREDDPCPSGGQLTIDIHTLKVDCQQIKLQAVFDPPQVRCPAGSFLDFTGQCRDELVQKFRSSFAVQPSTRSLCPEGFTATPAGHCVNTGLEGGGGGLGR